MTGLELPKLGDSTWVLTLRAPRSGSECGSAGVPAELRESSEQRRCGVESQPCPPSARRAPPNTFGLEYVLRA